MPNDEPLGCYHSKITPSTTTFKEAESVKAFFGTEMDLGYSRNAQKTATFSVQTQLYTRYPNVAWNMRFLYRLLILHKGNIPLPQKMVTKKSMKALRSKLSFAKYNKAHMLIVQSVSDFESPG